MKKYLFFLLCLLPLTTWAQLVINNTYVKLNGGTLAKPIMIVLTNPSPAFGIKATNGWVISEGEFNMVQWNIGTSVGAYVLPFGFSTAQYLPLTLNIGTAGAGAGVIKFSTYHTLALNSTNEPSDVTNVTPYILPGSPSNTDNSYNIADRFYIIDANTGYATKPAASNITFSYISGTANSEVAPANTLVESHLLAQRFNTSTSTWNDWFGWSCTDAIIGNVGTVQSGPVPAVDMYRSWSLWDNLTPFPVTITTTNVSCSSISATANASGGLTPYTYSWSPSGGTNATASGLSTGSYTVNVQDNHGCTSTASIAITQPASSLAIAIGSHTNSSGCISNGTITANAATGGTAPYTYSWTPNGGTNLIASNLSAGTYTITVTDNATCTANASINITSPAALTASAVVNTNAGNCTNAGSATATAGGGNAPYVYTWNPGGQATASVSALAAGNYTVTVTDANGCNNTASVSITQASSLTTAVAITEPTCGNITGSATVTPGGGAAPYTYSWNPGGQATASVNGLTAGNYTLTVTDNSSCQILDVINITQPTLLTATITTTNYPLCNGNTGGATVTPGGGTNPYTYSWTPAGGNLATANGLSAGTYTVSVSETNACTATASVLITQPVLLTTILNTTSTNCSGGNTASISSTTNGGTLPYTYSWSNAQTTTNVTNLSTGTYSLTLTDANACSTTASVAITQPAPFSVTASATPAAICSGQTSTLATSAGAGDTYVWSPATNCNTCASPTVNPTITTVYSVTVTNAGGCTANATIAVSVSTGAANLTVSPNQNICAGQTATLSVSGNGTDFTWQPGNNTNTTILVNPEATTIYTVTLPGSCGISTAHVTVFVNPIPVPQFSADISSGCAPLCVQFRNLSSVSSGNISSYSWKFGTGDSTNSLNPIYCYPASGNFSVDLTATSDNGCSATLSRYNNINVFSRPQAAFIASPQPLTMLQPTVQFTDKSTDAYGISEWYWGFGDESDSTSQQENPSHTYHDTGTYCATLIVVNAHGCVDSVRDCLKMSPLFALYIPSAFSPNGDGLNDVFQAKGNDVKSFEMYIFDRWGMQIFHSTDINNGWDGSFKGGQCQEDSYPYLINVYDTENNLHSYTGEVNLLK